MNTSTAPNLENRVASSEWYAGARSYLNRLGQLEYEQQRQAHQRGRRSPGTFIFCASEFYRALNDCLEQGDQELFSLLRSEHGARSALGH